ncbi:MAG: PIN domain-containing protein [Thermofilaceae archaeon]
MPEKKVVVIDSSAIIACLEDRRDLFEALRDTFEGGVEVAVPNAVLEELKKLATQSGRRKLAAKSALQLLQRGSDDIVVRVIDVDAKSTDEALLKLSMELNACLITLDRELRKTAEAKGITALTYLRSKKRFG